MTHIWELGGGAILAKLVDIPITVETIRLARVDCWLHIDKVYLYNYNLYIHVSVYLSI